MIQLRDYQAQVDAEITARFAEGHRYVCAVMPTGAGKTVLFTDRAHKHIGLVVEIAHRQELVSQMSMALAEEGVRHGIFAPTNVARNIARLHTETLGGCWYDPAARVIVAGVDTLIRRQPIWAQQVSLIIMDECHHWLVNNKWGKAGAMFPNAKGLGVTATPGRADGKGLGAHADGVFTAMVEGPTMQELIDRKFLSPFRIFCPGSDVDLASVPVGKSGEFVQKEVSKAVRRSHLVGDVVKSYLKFAPGKLGVTFAVDVESATELVAEYLNAGVSAALITAKTPDRERYLLMRRFRARDLMQLVNVDIIGEGVDVPGIEVVSFARPTASWPLYCQQFGRAMRYIEGKVAIIIDHVDNVRRHGGAPTRPQVFTLDRAPTVRRGERDPDLIPQRICVNCSSPYEACYTVCPYCRHPWTPARRDGPLHVDGDLVELDPATLQAMHTEVARVDESPAAVRARMTAAGCPPIVAAGAAAQHRRRQEAQVSLRPLLETYGRLHATRGQNASEAQRRFWFRYGLTPLDACALSRPETEQLTARLIRDLGRAV